MRQVMRCDICSKNGHPTDSCPHCTRRKIMSKLMLWEDSKAKIVFKESMILSPILIIRGGKTILILVMEGINK